MSDSGRARKQEIAELTSIYNTVPCGILRLLRTEKGCRLLTFNKTLRELLEWSEEEVRKADWSDGFADDVVSRDRQILRDSIGQLKKPGDVSRVDYRIATRSGNTVCLSGTNLLIAEEEEGQIIQRIIFDITERMSLEAALKRMSFEDSLTGLFNRNRFNRVMNDGPEKERKHLGVAYFDLNGLKEINDRLGHSAGDDLICRAANHIGGMFRRKAYRIGGDEFIVIDDESDGSSFREAVARVCREMERNDISIAVGLSWRSSDCDLKKQFEEADRRMYEAKKRYYSGFSDF